MRHTPEWNLQTQDHNSISGLQWHVGQAPPAPHACNFLYFAVATTYIFPLQLSAFHACKKQFEVLGISEMALKRREEMLEAELLESFGADSNVTRGMIFTSRMSSAKEREFLRAEYDGYGQICQTAIQDYKGRNYFEAINILRISEMAEKLLNSIDLGWNSLCLCPNCAAMYKHGSKRISGIYDQVIRQTIEPDSTESIDLAIEMPAGCEKKIHYSPRHFLALKKAFELM